MLFLCDLMFYVCVCVVCYAVDCCFADFVVLLLVCWFDLCFAVSGVWVGACCCLCGGLPLAGWFAVCLFGGR